MPTTGYCDVELLVRDWILTTPVAPLVTAGSGQVMVFRAMPNGSPLPSLILSRVGGGPRARSDCSEDVARISFECWAANRNDAANLARVLVVACERLAETGGFNTPAGRLAAAEVVTWVWVPDPASDTPRYIVDGLFTTIPG